VATVLPLHSPPSPDLIHQVAQCLQEGGVVAVPTDSFYGLAVNPFNQAALERLMHIKGERSHKPFPVLIGDPSQLDQLVTHIPQIARTLMQQFWPGLLTLVLNAQAHLSPVVTGDNGTIGVRQPNDARLCELLKKTGPVTGTSANRTGQPPAQSAEEVMKHLGSEINLILDGGPTPGGQPSTVLQVVPEHRILREGAISRLKLQAVIDRKGKPLSW
jgi:L-threonylcarbamoyladenylate synthase